MSDRWERRFLYLFVAVAATEFAFIGNLMTSDLPWSRREIEEVKRYSTEIYRVASVEEVRDLLPWGVRRSGTMAFVQLIPDDFGYVKVRFTRNERLVEAIRAYTAENGEFPEIHLVAEITETRHAMILGDIFYSSTIRNHVVRVDGNAETVDAIMGWYSSRPASDTRT